MSTVGRYRILGEVGRGDLSMVYKGVDPLLNRVVAVKTFPYQVDTSDPHARAWKDLFHRQIEAAAKLDHPGIVRVFDVGFEADRVYVVMEFVEGEPLSEVIRVRALPLSEKLAIAVQAAEALGAAHAMGIIHQHIRPTNILVASDGDVKVTDFGLAELAAPVGESTPIPDPLRIHYRAPEQVYGKRADERTDIFSLGVVLYEMLLGRRPFDGLSWIQVTQKILTADPPFLKESSGDFPDAVHHLLGKALAKDPLDRHQTMRELATDLKALHKLAEGSLGSTGPSWRTPAEGETLAGIAPSGAHLVVYDDGQRRVVPIGAAEFTIGRRHENDLSLKDEHISRLHAKLVLEDGRYHVVDTESKHGTFLNGERVKHAPLTDGDRLDLGRSRRFRFVFHTGAAPNDSATPASLEPSGQGQHLELLLDISRALNSSLSVDDVLKLVMDAAVSFTSAERGFVMLKDATGRFTTRVSRHMAGAASIEEERSVSTGVVERCLASGTPIVIHNVDEFSDFAQRESIHGQSLKSILCVPLISKGSNVLGALYLDSRQLKAPFRQAQLDLLTAFASHAAVAIENARLYELAIVDGVTGVFMRHHFDVRLAEEFQRAQRHRSHSQLSLVFMDLDHFKKINDTYGHQVGDQVLRVTGQTLKGVARSTDIAARYGGEEFVLIAPETRLDYAVALAERLRAALAAQTFTAGDATFTLTASFGVARYPQAGIDTPEELVRAADDALFRAKSQGRNQVCIAEPRPDPPPNP